MCFLRVFILFRKGTMNVLYCRKGFSWPEPRRSIHSNPIIIWKLFSENDGDNYNHFIFIAGGKCGKQQAGGECRRHEIDCVEHGCHQLLVRSHRMIVKRYESPVVCFSPGESGNGHWRWIIDLSYYCLFTVRCLTSEVLGANGSGLTGRCWLIEG